MSEPTRLEALYEELADARATQDGLWVELERSTPDERAGKIDYLTSLEREESRLVEEIESLGGEDPEL